MLIALNYNKWPVGYQCPLAIENYSNKNSGIWNHHIELNYTLTVSQISKVSSPTKAFFYYKI